MPHSRIGDIDAIQVEPLQLSQPRDFDQAVIRYPGLIEAERAQVFQRAEPLDTLVGDLSGVEIERSELCQALKMRQTGVGDCSSIQREESQFRQAV